MMVLRLERVSESPAGLIKQSAGLPIQKSGVGPENVYIYLTGSQEVKMLLVPEA